MLTLLLCHERSGSHLLGEALGSLKGVRVLDEVCNPHAVPSQKFSFSYYRFLHNWSRDNPHYLLDPTFDAQKEFNKAYFDLLQISSEHHSMIADVKYGHVHQFEKFWWPVFRRPFLFTCCEEFGIKIIHLYRENVLEAAVSAHLSAKRKIWHSWQPEAEKRSEVPLELPIQAVVTDAELLATQTQWIKKWLHGVNHMTVTYEQISNEFGGESGKLLEELAVFVEGETVLPFKPKLSKLGRPLRESVVNYDSLAQACVGTNLEKML